MSGRNVVPMPMPHGQTQGQMMPMPQMWGGGSSYPAGCCPPGDMSSLLQCYCDVQAATAFISKVVTDLAANDPAFQKALVDGIAASGSNLPLLGVTNGSDAQPGQVGEYIQSNVNVSYTTAMQTQNVTMGVLQPGDWDCWQFCECTTFMTGVQFILAPVPVGFSNTMQGAAVDSNGQVGTVVNGSAARATLSVPTLVVFSLVTNGEGAGPAAGTAVMSFNARRRR